VLVARSDHRTGSRSIKLEVVFKVQKMARYAPFCLIMAHLRGKCLFLPDYGPFGRRSMRRDALMGPAILGLGLVLCWGISVGHPSNSWVSCFVTSLLFVMEFCRMPF